MSERMGYPTPTGTPLQVTQVHTNRSAVAAPKYDAVTTNSQSYVAQAVRRAAFMADKVYISSGPIFSGMRLQL